MPVFQGDTLTIDMNIFNRFVHGLCVVMGLMVLASCHKATGTGGDEITPGSSNNKLIVSFSSATIPINSVDSVIATFTGGTDTVRKKALREGSFYSFLFSTLPGTGTYSFTAKIYTAADSNGVQHMYHYQGSVNTSSTTNLIGATAKPYDLWTPANYFYNAKYNVTFAMGQSPTDPYFELTLPPNLPFKYVYIARNLYNTVNKVKYPAGLAYVNLNVADYKGTHINTTAFKSFATTAATATYTSSDISFELYNDISNDYAILFYKETAK